MQRKNENEVTSMKPADINKARIVLRELYDLCNLYFKDYPECFYTHEEIEEKKKSGDYIFI